MLSEFFQSLFSSAPAWAKKQNLVRESIAIAARYHRQKSHWASHLINCQNEILKFKNEYPAAKKIAVFGSGHLLDFPHELLSTSTLEIFLFDAVHPKHLKRAGYQAKLHFICADLNLNSDFLFEEYGEVINQCDLFISTNLLSQLAIAGSAHLSKKEVERTIFAQALIKNHLSFLKALPREKFLISDFEKKFISAQQEVLVDESSLWKYEMPVPLRSWDWDLAPIGEASNDYRVELKVGTWRL